jgi:RNA polymerase II subunit A C-terminal domain phosphatase
MLLRLPDSLHYPIVLVKIEKQTRDTVNKNDPLFLYSYTTTVKQGNRFDNEETEVEKKFATHFQSTLNGVIKNWRVWEGDILDGPVDICEVEEECSHPVQYQGLCVSCGKDMTQIQSSDGVPDTERAPIRMAHTDPNLTISKDIAFNIEEESKRRLLAARKLSLVVDLDQTIIHAAVDPTIGEWMRDQDSPNYPAAKDVRAFALNENGLREGDCWYYIKMRPGLADFLEKIAPMFEMQIYTAATRQYAQQVANLADPHRKYFGDRIFSRDESGNPSSKSLERLFPVDQKMVVIIDDRGDVWHWNHHLVRVTPFEFFKGIGDINSSFLPKKDDIQPQPTPQPDALVPKNMEPKTAEDARMGADIISNGKAEENPTVVPDGTSALDHLIAKGVSDDPTARELQAKDREGMIAAQLEEKPLLKMQQQQDEKDDEEAATATAQTNGDAHPPQPNEPESDSSESSEASQSKPKPRHKAILNNDDDELFHLERSLTAIYSAFFKEWDKKRLSGKGGRVGALAGKKKPPLPGADEDDVPSDLAQVPDVASIIPSMKKRVLSGVVIAYSGVIPLGHSIQNADISLWAKTFGAKIAEDITRDVTHLLARRPGTAKVKKAVKRGIPVLQDVWLVHCLQRWRKLDEKPYLLPGAGKQKVNDASDHGDAFDQAITPQDLMLSSSEDDSPDFDTDGDEPARKKPKLEVSTENGEMDDDDDDNRKGSPVTLNQEDWDEIDAELKEFMGSDADSESEAESVSSSLSYRDKRKRNRDAMQQEDDAIDGRSSGSKGSRGSRLKAVANVSSDKESTGPNAPTQGDQDRAIAEEQRKVEGQGEREQAEEDSDDELAREFERELEEADDQDDHY